MYQSLRLKPGIDVEQTALLNSSGWSYSRAIRWRDGLAEKIGGWAHLNNQTLIGVCTGMHAWADLSSNLYIAAGTDQRLELFYGGAITDITPLRATSNAAPDFSTVATSKTVTVVDTANGAAAGDWINIYVPVSVGGIVLQGFYQVQTIVDSDTYTITAADAATATVSHGGAVPTFTTTMSSGNVTVTLDNHGQTAGEIFTVQVATTVGGITIDASIYTVTAPVTTNDFVIVPGGTASSGATVAENGGNARIEYLYPTGLQSATYETGGGGYGAGDYGAGDYGGGSGGTVLVPLRQWFLDNFGQDLVGNCTGSPLFLWEPPVALGNVAKAINITNFPDAVDPPAQVNVSFVAAPQQMIIALGASSVGGGTFDPNLVRWCDQSDFLTWQASGTNLAGSYRIPSGSRLVGGIPAPNFIAIWTDVDMWLMSYLGGTGLSELVWGFSKVAGGAGLLSARGCGIYKNLVFFASSNGVYVFDGNRISLIPCPVWDKFWKNLNRTQVDKVNMQVNSYFQEVAISSPSATGDGTVDQRIKYSIRDGTWDYDDAPAQTPRTAWIDENVYGAPIGTDMTGYMQQQDSEGVYDADGQPLLSSARTGWFSVQEGTLVSMMERIEGDFIDNGGTGTVYLTVYAKDYAAETARYPVRTYGPFAWTIGQGPPWQIVRARGRFMSIEISSQDTGVFWRQGNIRYRVAQRGRRP